MTPLGGSRPNWRACGSQELRRCASHCFRVFEAADARHGVVGVDEVEHPGALEQSFFRGEHIGDAIRRQRVAGTMACEIARSASSSVKPRRLAAMASTPLASSWSLMVWRAGHAGVGFLDDRAQAVEVGQRQVEELDQAGQFRRHFDRGRGDHQRPAVGRRISAPRRAGGARPPGCPCGDESLSARTRLDRHRPPYWRAPAPDRSMLYTAALRRCGGIGTDRRVRARQRSASLLPAVSSPSAYQDALYTPARRPARQNAPARRRSSTQKRPGSAPNRPAHQRNSLYFLDCFHNDDGSGGIDENLEAFDWSLSRIHICLTQRDLLPYNLSFGSHRNIFLAQSRTNEGNKEAWRIIFRR